MISRSSVRWILKNTLVSNASLTPELKLRLITEASPLWMSTPDKCPFPDPYWAFYWPGGQAATRYVLDKSEAFNGAVVFDFGTGCGSVSLAASMSGAKLVVANDIDKHALLATKLNFRLNLVRDDNILYTEDNFLTDKDEFKLAALLGEENNVYVILGDMFYDSDFAAAIFSWLYRLKRVIPLKILVGDPDRHPLAEKKYVERYDVPFKKILLAEYPLPGYVIKEHYGFNTAKVYEIEL